MGLTQRGKKLCPCAWLEDYKVTFAVTPKRYFGIMGFFLGEMHASLLT